ncbi:hypothetical protein GQ457_02G040570 [Hibiscus cannabinus]
MHLKFSILPELADIWSRNPQEMLDLKSVEYLEVCDSDNLRYIFDLSLAQSMGRLHRLEIKRCINLEQVIKEEDSNTVAEGAIVTDANRIISIFPLLQFIHLESCSNTTSFYLGSTTLECPSLKEIVVADCPNMATFVSIFSRNGDEEAIIGVEADTFFSDKVGFPNLEKIKFSHLRNVKRIWYNQLQAGSFSKLKELKVEYCHGLLNIFPLLLLQVFQKLEILTVANCASLEQVFQLQVHGSESDIIEENNVVSSQLREVNLMHLPMLKHIWNKDPNGSLSFENLRRVYVLRCQSLKTLFPFSIAKNLPQLERLAVDICGAEEIVSKIDGGIEHEIWFEFNKLSSLKLWSLPNLICFYPGTHRTLWPALKKLTTYRCGKIKIFGHDEFQIPKPLLIIEQVIPQLEQVSFEVGDIAMINDSQFEADSFCNIRHLHITCHFDETNGFPFCFLQRFHNLETLDVGSCHFKELSPSEGGGSEDKETITRLPKFKKLRLDNVTNTRLLWTQEEHISASLESLEVLQCHSVMSLGSYFSTLQNLTTLEVLKCKEMTQLITSSKAQSLVSLVTMSIKDCETMMEVVASDGDETTYEIVFEKLKCLELDCLQSLTSFCSGKHKFRFPSLEQVILSQCPRMNNFCQGVLSTPELQKVQLTKTDFKGRWAGDLNATVEQIYKEQVGYRDLKHLKFSEFPELVDVWCRNPQEMLDLKGVEFLEICDSDNLRCIFNLSMALSLGRLQQLEIKRCSHLEQVIKENDSNTVAEEAVITDGNKIITIFPHLQSIVLECCSNMTSFYLGSNALECPSLKEIMVADCPNMTTFVSSVSRNGDEETIIGHEADTFFSDKVGYRGLKHLKFSEFPELVDIWCRNPQEMLYFRSLEFLEVCDSDNLRCIFNLSVALSLGRLQQLEIKRCSHLEQVIKEEDSNTMAEEVIITDGNKIIIIFPNLQSIVLESCSNMTSFYLGSTALECPSLKEIMVAECSNMTTFVSTFSRNRDEEETVGDEADTFLSDKVVYRNLKKIVVSHLRNVKTIWYNQLYVGSFSMLKELKVECCDALLNIFPYLGFQVFRRLEILTIIDCASLEQVFQLQVHASNIISSQLREVNLICLPKLKHVWNKDPNGSLSFENLRTVRIWECWSLKTLFPFSIAEHLLQLECLIVQNCGVEEIVSKNFEGIDQEIQFEFNQLSFIGLWNLPNLVCFYPGTHRLVWPVLKKLSTYCCGKTEIFGHVESQPQMPLLSIEKGKSILPPVAFGKARTDLKEKFQVHNYTRKPILPMGPKVVRWCPPSFPMLKLNVDGAFRIEDRSGAVGFVVRNSVGLVLGGGACFIREAYSADFVEAQAVIHALRFASSKGFKIIIIECDTLAVASKLKKKLPDFSMLGLFLEEAKQLMNSFEDVGVCYVHRSGNRVAHALASFGFDCNEPFTFGSNYPDFIKELVLSCM